MEKLGRSACRIASGNGFIVQKSRPPVRGLVRRISRLAFGGSLPFQNEKFVNELLLENAFQHLKYPRLLGINSDGSYEFEYIEGEDISDPSERDIIKAMKGLMEFNCLSANYRRTGTKWIALRILESPSIRTARFILKSNISLKRKISGLWLILSQRISHVKPCTVLMHNDLLFSNLRLGNDGNIYFLDFEDSIPESLMILADAVDLLLDRSRMALDVGTLRDYWECMAGRLKVDPEKLDLPAQIRLCLLRLSIVGRSRAASSEEQRNTLGSMCDIVLDKKSYDEWLQQQDRQSRGYFTK